MRLRAAVLPAINPAPRLASDASEDTRSEFEEGYEAGARAKFGEIETALAALLAARADLDRCTAALEAQFRRQCAATLAEIISAAAPSICAAAAREAIAGIFGHAAGPATFSELKLRASPDILEAIKDAVSPHQSAYFTMDDTLAPGTLEARWSDGGLDCDVGRSLFAIVEILNAHKAPSAEEQSP